MTQVFAPFAILSVFLVGARSLAATAAKVARLWRNRRDVHELAHLDDRALKDIGLTRSDVTGALQSPFHVDPSAMLWLRREERRGRSLPLMIVARDGRRTGFRLPAASAR